jgi:hypothetical protein
MSRLASLPSRRRLQGPAGEDGATWRFSFCSFSATNGLQGSADGRSTSFRFGERRAAGGLERDMRCPWSAQLHGRRDPATARRAAARGEHHQEGLQRGCAVILLSRTRRPGGQPRGGRRRCCLLPASRARCPLNLAAQKQRCLPCTLTGAKYAARERQRACERASERAAFPTALVCHVSKCQSPSSLLPAAAAPGTRGSSLLVRFPVRRWSACTRGTCAFAKRGLHGMAARTR